MRLLFALLALVAVHSASAQGDYPSKPVRMIVGFAAGGISDVLGRAVAITASKQLGQQVVVENKPGAGTTIAGDYIARSSPDGYTIWLQDITTHAINAALYAKLSYDSVNNRIPSSSSCQVTCFISMPTVFRRSNTSWTSAGSAGRARRTRP